MTANPSIERTLGTISSSCDAYESLTIFENDHGL